MRAQILAGDDPALAQAAARGDPAAGGAAALHDHDPGLGRAFECSALLWGRAARRKPGRDDPAGASGDRRIDERAIGAGIGIDNVDPWQRAEIEPAKGVSGMCGRDGLR